MATEPEYSRLIGRLRLRHLALLEQLARDPNLGRGAKQLHMAQPTASKLLREIEDVLETTLFTRNRRGMSPTIAGEAVMRRARVVLAEMHAAHLELSATRAGATGRLRIGVFPVAVSAFLPRFYNALRSRYPRLHLCIEEAVESALSARISDGRIDCIFGRVVIETLTPTLRHEALYREPTVIVCSPRHPYFKARGGHRILALQKSAWMLPDTNGATYNMVASWLALQNVGSPQVEIETSSVFTTIELLGHSELLSILPRSVALIYAKLGKLALVPGGNLTSNYPVGIIYRAEAVANPMLKVALATAREEFAVLARVDASQQAKGTPSS